MTTSRLPTVHRRKAAIACALLIVLTACDGDDTTSPTTLSIEPPDTFFVTTTEATPTTEPVTVTTPPTTAPATASTATTTEPATRVSTVADPEVQEIVDALLFANSSFSEVLFDPFNDEKLSTLRESRRGDALTGALEIVEDFRLRGLKAIKNESVPAAVVPLIDSVAIDGTTATIEYCWVNSDMVVEVGGAADGSDLLVDDTLTVSRDLETYEFIDGQWRKTRGVVVETYEGESCDDIG